MASIEIRPNGSVRVAWRVDGRQDRITVDGIKDAEMLRKWLDRNGPRPSTDPDLLYAIGRAPVRTMDDPVTVKEALDDMVNRPGLADGSRRRYRVNINRHLNALHDMTVQTLSRGDVDAVMADLQARGYKEATWRGAAICLATAIRPYGKADLCKGYAGRTKNRHRDPVVMTKATMDLITALGDDHGIGDLLAIIADMGLRYGEATAADRDHCDIVGDRPVFRVRQQYRAESQGKDADRGPTATKTPRGRRDVPMSPRLVELAERTPAGRLLTVDGYVGRGPWRHGIANYRLGRVSRVAIEEGLIDRPVHFHDFRHSWGAHLLLGGVDIVTVSRLMGHSSVEITGDTYGHLTAAGLDAARMLLK